MGAGRGGRRQAERAPGRRADRTGRGRRVLTEGTLDVELTRRARVRLERIRDDFSWIDATGTAVVSDPAGATRWWTFAGLRANTTLGELIGPLRQSRSREENLAIRLADGATVEDLKRRLDDADATGNVVPVTDAAVDSLKFSACLPRELAVRALRARGSDPGAVRACRGEPIRQVVLG